MHRFVVWCGSNTTGAKVARTIFQGVVSFLIVMIPQWAAGYLPAQVTACIIPAVMAVLAAFQSWLGKRGVYDMGDAPAVSALTAEDVAAIMGAGNDDA